GEVEQRECQPDDSPIRAASAHVGGLWVARGCDGTTGQAICPWAAMPSLASHSATLRDIIVARCSSIREAMPHRTGSADLPLHGGYVPAWLSARMARLGGVIAQAIVHHYGRAELLRRLSHPFWFQSFGAVMGMDWHSSGITTSVIGALKRALTPLQAELGIYVCGGKGAHSRKTPQELVCVGERTGLDAEPLSRASRLV